MEIESKDPKRRLKEGSKAAVITLFNVGSFAMNIWLTINLIGQCEKQANNLRTMIATYNDISTLEALIDGCKDDPVKLQAVKDYLKKMSSDASFNDPESQNLLKDGLRVTLSNYNTNVNGWITELDKFYNNIQKVIIDAVEIGSKAVSQELANILSSGYDNFNEQVKILKNTKETSIDRLQSSRKIVEISGETISDITNNILKEYQKALVDSMVAKWLVNKAERIVKVPSRLQEFNQDKELYVKNEDFLADLDFVYSDRTVFKDPDPNKSISQIAEFLDIAIKDILNQQP